MPDFRPTADGRCHERAVTFGREVCGDFAAAHAREWLVTNGIGGYASGTIGGALTRTYHGYLVAALEPPGARTLLVAKLDESCTYAGETFDLATNSWASGAIAPRGYVRLERFYLDGTTPVWEFAFAGALVEKRLTLRPGHNVAVVRYAVLRASDSIAFDVRAIVDRRDHNATTVAGALPSATCRDAAAVLHFPDAPPDESLYLRCDRCVPLLANAWYYGYALARERERGLPDRDDHVHAATFAFSLSAGERAHVWAAPSDVRSTDASLAFVERAAHERMLCDRATPASALETQLVLAADQFVVTRTSEAEPDGKTIIAGYHWFADWGRDTAISLPGLTLATGRPEIARAVLLTFARYVDRGLIPNAFPDRGTTPHYNTVDAALWYVEAVRAYVEAAGYDAAFEALYDACLRIVTGYRDGTRYHIAMDASDALIYAGEPGVQLTWMDAKYGDTVVTPRIGKAVEINALWYNALRTVEGFARACGRDAAPYGALADRVQASLRRFERADGRGAYDVLDGPDGPDASIRPNQLFAVSLRHAVVTGAAARAIVDVCARELVTSHGLRTFAPSDPRYIASYAGTREERDRAYHQGTIWPWLLGPFVRAYARAYDDAATARTFLRPLLESLGAYGLGTLGEITDGSAPFGWKGAIAQAWSVAETLRALRELGSPVT